LQIDEVYNSIKIFIIKAISSVLLNRAYIIVLRGAHKSGKSFLLDRLVSDFKEKMRILNFNLIYTNHSIKSKSERKEIEHPLKVIRDKIELYSKSYDIIAIDHLERFYKSIDSIEPLISTLIQKSRQFYINNHHVIIILTFPISESLELLNRSFSDLKAQRNAIHIFNL